MEKRNEGEEEARRGQRLLEEGTAVWPAPSFSTAPSPLTRDFTLVNTCYSMDEVTALRQQVAALQLQNTQLMVRLSAVSILILGILLPWFWLYYSGESHGGAFVAIDEDTSSLTPIAQGLLRDQAPSPQPSNDAPPLESSSGQDAYTVGVMVLGASGTQILPPRILFSYSAGNMKIAALQSRGVGGFHFSYCSSQSLTVAQPPSLCVVEQMVVRISVSHVACCFCFCVCRRLVYKLDQATWRRRKRTLRCSICSAIG